jgi:hypothetical protein
MFEGFCWGSSECQRQCYFYVRGAAVVVERIGHRDGIYEGWVMSAATVTIDGKRFVILPEAEYERMRGGRPSADDGLPPLPKALANGNYPAIEYARAVAARDIITARRRLGLSQAELARRAGIRALDSEPR